MQGGGDIQARPGHLEFLYLEGNLCVVSRSKWAGFNGFETFLLQEKMDSKSTFFVLLCPENENLWNKMKIFMPGLNCVVDYNWKRNALM